MKVLLVYGDVGGGHASAARALKEAFHLVYQDRFQVEAVDLYKIADPAPWGNSDASFTAFSQTALLRNLNYFYNIITDFGLGHYLLKQTILKQTLGAYRAFFEKSKPDLIVSLHPYTNITISKLREQGLTTPYAVVVTDLASVLRGWADPSADVTFSPTEKVTAVLEKLGVAKNKIITSLFPIRPSLQQVIPKEELFTRHQLDPQCTTLVITGGGVATRALEGAIALLAGKSYQLIVMCGKDKIIAEKLRQDYKSNPSVVVLGFVQDMQNYFAHADVIISKAGANSVLEIELFEKRAIITHEVGSQEEGNAAYALENPRFRFLAGDMTKLLPSLERLLALPSEHLPPSRRTFDESLEIVKHLAALIR
ncbi:MAG: MGDG synthase family glycosyltransferase [Trueperaceae bacterium]